MQIIKIIKPWVRYYLLNRKILVGGMEASGSTLIYQFAKDLSHSHVSKTHEYEPGPGTKFVSYRDPRDVICSFARRQLGDIWQQAGAETALLLAHQKLFIELHRQTHLENYANDTRAVLIKYEAYIPGNELGILNIIAQQLGIDVKDATKQQYLAKYSIEENRKRSEQFTSFAEFDKESHIHGNHISSGGKSGVWKSLFTDVVRQAVKANLGQFLIDYGYETDKEW
jgi:hypothetical protein